MKSRWIITVSLASMALFQTLPAWAQSSAPAPVASPTAAVAQRTVTPALWVLKDADTTIYLFGTFHFLPPGLNWNLGPVKAAFDSADTLKLEIANLEADTPAIAALIAEKGKLATGQTLSDGLNTAQQANLNRVIRETNIPPQAISSLRPWLASLYMTVTLYQKMGLDPTKGVDKTLDGLARARNIPVEGFETGAEQIAFFTNMAPAQERALLLSTLEDWDQAQKTLDGMVNAWARGDANRIGRMLSDSLRSQPELERILMTDRNSQWADWIGARMATPGTVFVAVGAGHLAGPQSVQSYLRKKGFRTQRVPNRTPR